MKGINAFLKNSAKNNTAMHEDVEKRMQFTMTRIRMKLQEIEHNFHFFFSRSLYEKKYLKVFLFLSP